jgi:hypothetical protein
MTKQKVPQYLQPLDLGLLAFKTIRNKSLFLTNYPVWVLHGSMHLSSHLHGKAKQENHGLWTMDLKQVPVSKIINLKYWGDG